jgi:hypothetical protein
MTASLPGLTRQSIRCRNRFSRRLMDTRHRPDHDPIRLNRIMVSSFYLSMIFSENRFPLFRIMLYREDALRAFARRFVTRPKKSRPRGGREVVADIFLLQLLEARSDS